MSARRKVQGRHPGGSTLVGPVLRFEACTLGDGRRRTPTQHREFSQLAVDRVAVVEGNLDAYLKQAAPSSRRLGPDDPLRPGSSLTARRAVELWKDHAISRALDVEARRLKATGRSFYTISGAGH